MAKKKESLKDVQPQKPMSREELREMLPKRLNKAGDYYFSNNPNKVYAVVNDWRAVMR